MVEDCCILTVAKSELMKDIRQVGKDRSGEEKEEEGVVAVECVTSMDTNLVQERPRKTIISTHTAPVSLHSHLNSDNLANKVIPTY